MANYQAIMRRLPEVRQFIRNRRWVHRGDIITYGPNIRCDAFSTDGFGFRHSVFGGETLSVRDCLQRERYGLVFGSSNLYGFGLGGNDNTIPSLLAQRFGFPFANVCLPEANSRNLHSLLSAYLARAPHPPAAVVHMSGGDFTNFCYTSIADAVFGSPNIKQIAMVQAERGQLPAPDTQIRALLDFTALWTRQIVQACQRRGVPVVLGNDTTFFEKAEPDPGEAEAALGQAVGAAQERQFATHRRFVDAFYARRQGLAERLGVPLAGFGASNSIGFVDEFHYDRDGTRALAERFGDALAPLLSGR
jgi:lysophospholipase L1-like esterase